jgi:hypothetical protein
MSDPEAKRRLIEQLTDRFLDDPEFREQMRLDPEGTAERLGIPLTEEDRQAMRTIDWSLPDEQLTERASKMPLLCKSSAACQKSSGYCG